MGKFGVDERVLRQLAELEPDEWDHAQRRPELGAHMLRAVPFCQASLSCVLYQQEWYEGRSHPYRLTAEHISLEARVKTRRPVAGPFTSPGSLILTGLLLQIEELAQRFQRRQAEHVETPQLRERRVVGRVVGLRAVGRRRRPGRGGSPLQFRD